MHQQNRERNCLFFMKRNIIFIIFVASIILGMGLLFVSRAPQVLLGDGKIHVVASFYPLAYVASVVGGDFVTVRTLTPAGAEPHDFELSPQDFIEIGKSNVLFYNGASFEPWVEKWGISGHPQNVKVVDMAKSLDIYGVPLLLRNGAVNPHFWLDPMIYKKEVEVVRDTLIAIDPAHQDNFRQHAELLINKLDILDQDFQKGLASCASHDIVVSHDAFGYLGARYGIGVTSIAGISPDEEPAPKDLARIAVIAREKKVQYIFSETIANPKFSEAIAREIGATTLVLNPLESLTPLEVQSGEDYISKMEINLLNLKKAMLCQ